jgi:cytochrome P450
MSLTPAAPKPDHIPDAVVYDFDIFHDPALKQDAYKRAMQIVKEAPPVFWTPRNGGHWLIAGHKAVFDASRDPALFTSEYIPFEKIQEMRAALPPGAPHLLQPTPITMDPPTHTTYRLPLQGVFSPKAMGNLKEHVRTLASKLLDDVKANGKCEFMNEIAEPLPVQVFLELFGLPVERQRQYRDLVKEHMSQENTDPKQMQQRLYKLTDVMHDTIVDRRDNPKNDMISMLWKSEFNGKPATLNDLEDYCVVLFTAGLDTVMNAMGLGVLHFATHLDLQNKLRADPSLISDATEEMLRRYTFTLPPRWSAKDQEFFGAPMKKGERAVLMLPTADLDPKEFESPENFELQRDKVHIAFGVGPHRCLGSHLARIELNILYEEMLKRLPEFRLDASKPVTYHGGHVWGPDQVHLVW